LEEGILKIHSRQFIIGPKPVEVDKEWSVIKLKSNFYLSYCKNLPISYTKDVEGESWYILGLAVQTETGRLDPVKEISQSLTKDVCNLYGSWAGRWVLIGNGEIHMDATGLLGCYYIIEENTKSIPAIWISSSPVLLRDISMYRNTMKTWGEIFCAGLNWYPLPLSRFEGVRKLFPSQIIRYMDRKMTILPRPLISGLKVLAGLSYDQKLKLLKERLVTAVQQAARLYKTIWLPLTAGYDSRLLLAIMKEAGVEAKTFTQNHRRISYADKGFPPFLAKEIGLKHYWIAEKGFSRRYLKTYDEHTGKHAVDGDRYLFSHRQWDGFQKDDLILRGGIFEVGRCCYWDRFHAYPIATPNQILDGLYGLYKGKKYPHIMALSQWIQWITQTNDYWLDWRDRFYIEQIAAGWLSAIEQSLDLTACERFYPANAQDTIAILLSIPEDKRFAFSHHTDLINHLAPELLKYPFNPPDHFAACVVKRIMQFYTLPFHGKYEFVISMIKRAVIPKCRQIIDLQGEMRA